MKKRFVGMLTAIAMISVMSACASAPNSNSGGAPANTGGQSQTEVKEESAAPEEVELVVWDKVKDTDPAKVVRLQIQQDFDAKYPHIKVRHEVMAEGNDRQIFLTAMAGGQGPDAYQSAHFPVMGDWIKQGFALDLSEYWADYADKDHFLSSAMAHATVDGKVYGIPNSVYVMGLFYNKDHFADAGLDPEAPPQTWEEFVEVGKKLASNDGSRYPYALLGMDWADWYFEYYVWQAGGDLTTLREDGTVELDFTKEPTVKALEYYRDMKWKHKLVQNNVLQSYDENMNDFLQGRASMVVTSHQWISSFVNNGLNFGFAPMPKGPAGVAPSQTGGQFWIINPTVSKAKQDAAWTYITYMMSKEVQEKLMTFAEEEGQVPELLPVRSDIDAGSYTSSVSPDLVASVQKVAEHTQLEYYLKERLGPYITKAIQAVLTDEKADLMKALQDAEQLARKEVIDPYNAEIKS